jgi:hypothetical protein
MVAQEQRAAYEALVDRRPATSETDSVASGDTKSAAPAEASHR